MIHPCSYLQPLSWYDLCSKVLNENYVRRSSYITTLEIQEQKTKEFRKLTPHRPHLLHRPPTGNSCGESMPWDPGPVQSHLVLKYANSRSSKILSSKNKKVCSLKLLVFMLQKKKKIISSGTNTKGHLLPSEHKFLFPTIKVNTLMYSNIFILKKREKHDEKGCRAL